MVCGVVWVFGEYGDVLGCLELFFVLFVCFSADDDVVVSGELWEFVGDDEGGHGGVLL